MNQFKGGCASARDGLMAATSLAAVLFLIIPFIIAQRQIVEGIALSGSKTPVRSYVTARANEQVKALLQ